MTDDFYDGGAGSGPRRPKPSPRGEFLPGRPDPRQPAAFSEPYEPPLEAEGVDQPPVPRPRLPRLPGPPDLVGLAVQGRRPFSVAALVFAMVALPFAFGGVVGPNYHVFLAGAAPLSLALAWWWYRPRPFSAQFTDTALKVEYPTLSLPYEWIQEVQDRRKPRDQAEDADSFPIHVYFDRGFLTIPGGLNVSSEEVYSFLWWRKGSATSSIPVPATLESYCRRQSALFGGDRLWIFHARKRIMPSRAVEGGKAFGCGIFLAGLCWLLASVATAFFKDWLGVGIGLVIAGPLVWSIFWLARGNPVGKGPKSCLVISPVGLALVQGDLKGELRWEELLDVKLRAKGTASGIYLKVEGIQIHLHNIYNRPMEYIYRLIQALRRED